METEKQEAKRAIVEYKEISSVDEKPVKFKTVIEAAKDAADARVQFWALRIWPAALTQGIHILSITWPDGE